MPRLKLTEEEVLIITRRREREALDRAAWNSAINAVLNLIAEGKDEGSVLESAMVKVSRVEALRK